MRTFVRLAQKDAYKRDRKEIGAWRLDASWTERCRPRCTIDRYTDDVKRERMKKRRVGREERKERNNQVAERRQTWRSRRQFLFPSGAHEFYTFSMGARLSIAASASLYIPLSSRTHVHDDTQGLRHRYRRARARAHRPIHVTRHTENTFSAALAKQSEMV